MQLAAVIHCLGTLASPETSTFHPALRCAAITLMVWSYTPLSTGEINYEMQISLSMKLESFVDTDSPGRHIHPYKKK